MDNKYENIVPWNGANDTGRDARLKLERNFSKIGLNFDEVVRKFADADDLFALIAEELEKKLSKIELDTAQELITFLKGVLIGDNGSGITVLDNGMSQAVVDYLYVKVKAVFDELEVKKKTYVGGEQVISHAGMKCIKVEELADAYRCYFKVKEDDMEIENQFSVGSLAIAQECNIKTGVSQHVGNRYYWRAVTSVGTDYVDLSKMDCDPNVVNDIPAAGDDIVGLGHKTDITRQGAIILSSVNEVAPSIIMYQGIDDFSLAGKEVIALDFDKSTGRARMRVYGDTYIGARDRSSFVELTSEGVEIKAKKIFLGSGDTLDGKLSDVDDTLDEISGSLSDVSRQLDGSFQIWQGETADVPTLTNEPASDWVTDGDLDNHTGDFYITTEGVCYQFVLESGSYRWKIVTDKYLIAYLEQIGEKKRVFTTQPTDAVAYDIGDTWVNATYEDIYDNDRLVCITAKVAGDAFRIGHWQKDSKYTDDKKVEETVEKLLATGIDIENNAITSTADKFTVQGRDGKAYAVFEVDESTGEPVARMTGALIAKVIMAGGLDIDDKFVVAVKDGHVTVSVKGDLDTGDGVTHLDKDGSGWLGKVGDMYFAQWDSLMNWVLCGGNISWDNVNKVLGITGKVEAQGGSKIGNLTIGKNGSMSGGNAVFEDIGYLWVPVAGGSQESIDAQVRKTVVNQIGKSTTILLSMAIGSANHTYAVDLPTRGELDAQGVPSRYGFRITLIAAGSCDFASGFGGLGLGLNPTFRISSRPREKVSVNFQERELPAGEMHDNGGNRIEYLDMSEGDILELYYYNGIYYVLNRRT